MSENITEVSPRLVSKKQVQTILQVGKRVPSNRKDIKRIFTIGDHAFLTDRFIAVRWKLDIKLPDYSWISITANQHSGDNMKYDTVHNMANWYRVASSDDSWDLNDAERWNKPDDSVTDNDVRRIFNYGRGDKTLQHVAFNHTYLNDVISLLPMDRSRCTVLIPSKSENTDIEPWYVTGTDLYDDVIGLIVPMRCNMEEKEFENVALDDGFKGKRL